MHGFYLHPNTKQEIIDTSEEDVIATNREGIIVKASQISGRHYGIDPYDLLGKSVYDLEKEGIFSPAITPIVLARKKKVVLVQMTPSDGKVLITGIPFFDEKGEIEFVISYSYEVSELLIMQDYLKELEYEMITAKEELMLLRQEKIAIDGVIIQNRFTKQAYESARKVAELDVPVAISGEYGTGKSTLAKWIHHASKRREGPFIEVDCAIIPEALFEQKLFGVKNEQLGLFTLAQGGTLYLKNIERLAVSLQVKLAQALQDGTYFSEYAQEERLVDVRIISSSECNMKAQDSLHKSLYYQICIVPIELKPLRERPEDLSRFISFYLQEVLNKYNVQRTLRNDLFTHLLNLEWQGNFAEVMNVVERLVVETTSTEISLQDLPAEYKPTSEDELFNIELEGSLPSILERVERKVVRNAKERYRTTTEMAKFLGISQPTVVRKLKKYTEV